MANNNNDDDLNFSNAAPGIPRPNAAPGAGASIGSPIRPDGATQSATGGSAPQAPTSIPSAGTATVNGRAISPDEINRLANTNVIPTASFTRPGIGTLGNDVTPAVGVNMAAMNTSRPTAFSDSLSQPGFIARPGSYDPTDAARDYRTDLASILSKDPRSTLGTAAWNAYVDSKGNGSQGQAKYQNSIAALIGAARGTFDSQNQAGNANARDQTAWADNANTNTANVSRSGLLANSRLGAADARADAMNYGADTRADSARYVADARANTPKVDSAADAAYSRAYMAAMQNGATTDEARAAAGKVRLDLLRLRQQGMPGAQSLDDQQSPASPAAPGGGQSSSALQQPQQLSLQPPAAAIGFLRANPHFYDQFDAKYGKGAAAQYLRTQ